MKSLIAAGLILLALVPRAQGGRPSGSPRDTPNPKAFNHAASRPSGPVAVPAMTGWNVNVVDAIEVGGLYSVEIVDHLAYVGYGGVLVVLDISNPAATRKVGFTLLAGIYVRMVRSGDYLYCTTNADPNDYLQVVDLSNATEPVVVHTMTIQGDAFDVDGGFLYLEHGDGVQVYDVSSPASPQLRGFCASHSVMDMAARDGIVYVARGSGAQKGLQIVDATSPTNPTTVTILPVGVGTGPGDIDLSGNYVYALTFYGPNAFYIIDVSNPTTPTIASSVPGGSLIDVLVRGNRAYVNDANDFVRVFDVTYPASPAPLPAITSVCGSSNVSLKQLKGDVAAFGTDEGVCFADMTNPTAPAEIGSHESLWYGDSIDIAGGHLAISHGNGWLSTVNRYDASLRYEAPGTGWYVDMTHVAVGGDHAYVSMCDSWGYVEDDGLEVFDVTDPTNPTRIGLLPTSWCAREISIGASHVYLATHGEIWIVDVSNPALPTKASHVDQWVNDLAADEPYLYATEDDGLLVYDVSNPAAPTLVADLPLPGLLQGLWVSDSHAYIAAGSLFLIVDVSDPLNPFVVSSPPATYAWTVRVKDQYAYVTDQYHLRILDVTDPANPVEVGNIETTEFAPRVALAPPYIYLLTDGPLVVLETPMMTSVSHRDVALSLRQNYPNPFNPSTTIAFDTPSSGHVRLDIFDVRGALVRKLVDESMPAGAHSMVWDGRDSEGNVARSGVYFYRLEANGKSEARKMVILK